LRGNELDAGRGASHIQAGNRERQLSKKSCRLIFRTFDEYLREYRQAVQREAAEEELGRAAYPVACVVARFEKEYPALYRRALAEKPGAAEEIMLREFLLDFDGKSACEHALMILRVLKGTRLLKKLSQRLGEQKFLDPRGKLK
jgi:hypothetical protein